MNKGDAVSWDKEWAELKRQAGGDSGMRLASADGSGQQASSSSGSGDLVSQRSAWTKAGRDVEALRGDIHKSLTKLEDSHQGQAAGAGVQSAAARQELLVSWRRYLEGLNGRCSALQARLEQAGKELHLNDTAVKASFDKLSQQYKDTPAVGGQPQKK
ncbi:hypothetical protein ACFIN9_21395 [Streptomyces noursei]|uniref:hypothetical protein n=1 Tax=Streptomyces noursei TaxID=1971 RepID=UPI0036D3E306